MAKRNNNDADVNGDVSRSKVAKLAIDDGNNQNNPDDLIIPGAVRANEYEPSHFVDRDRGIYLGTLLLGLRHTSRGQVKSEEEIILALEFEPNSLPTANFIEEHNLQSHVLIIAALSLLENADISNIDSILIPEQLIPNGLDYIVISSTADMHLVRRRDMLSNINRTYDHLDFDDILFLDIIIQDLLNNNTEIDADMLQIFRTIYYERNPY